MNFELKRTICFPGNLSPPINDKKPVDDYVCESEEYTKTTAQVSWTYLVNCTNSGKEDDEAGDDKNPTCQVQITLTDTTPKPGSKAGLIIGIVILVIAVLVGVVALLG